MQGSLTWYNNYYDKISNDDEDIQQEEKDEGWVPEMSDVQKHGEVEIKGNAVIFHNTDISKKNTEMWNSQDFIWVNMRIGEMSLMLEIIIHFKQCLWVLIVCTTL